MGTTELLTALQDWNQLKTGDVIYSRKTHNPRYIKEAHNGCITLDKITHHEFKNWDGRRIYTKTTTYVPCDRHFFIVPGGRGTITHLHENTSE